MEKQNQTFRIVTHEIVERTFEITVNSEESHEDITELFEGRNVQSLSAIDQRDAAESEVKVKSVANLTQMAIDVANREQERLGLEMKAEASQDSAGRF